MTMAHSSLNKYVAKALIVDKKEINPDSFSKRDIFTLFIASLEVINELENRIKRLEVEKVEGIKL